MDGGNNPTSGEPMKTGIELVKEIRSARAHNYSSENADHYRSFDTGMANAADMVEAWLREADEFAESQQIINHNLGERDVAWAQAWLLARKHLLGPTPEGK